MHKYNKVCLGHLYKETRRMIAYLFILFLFLKKMIKTVKPDHLFKCTTNLSAWNPFEMMVAVFIACSFSCLYLTNTYNKGLDSIISPQPVYVNSNYSIHRTDDNGVILKQLILNNY